MSAEDAIQELDALLAEYKVKRDKAPPVGREIYDSVCTGIGLCIGTLKLAVLKRRRMEDGQ